MEQLDPTTQKRKWMGWTFVLALVGVGALLAMWMADGAPGWRLLVSGGGALAIILLLASLANSRRHPAAYTAAMLVFLALAWAGAWLVLQALAHLVSGLL